MKKVKTVITGVGSQIVSLIKEGKMSNTEILAKVRADNPLRKTTYACVAWYQSDLKKRAKLGAPVIAVNPWEIKEETIEELVAE